MNTQSSDDSKSAQPDALPAVRRAGVGLHITSLPGPYGIGEIGPEARDFVDKMCQMGLSVWQFLPTGPTAYGDSPYQPLSTFAGNENLISIAELSFIGLIREDEARQLTELPADFVDYGALIPLKSRLLRVAAQRFVESASGPLRDEFASFVDARDGRWLHDYALFRILKSQHGERPWPEWRPEFVRRDEDALAKLAAADADEVLAIKVLQFLFHRQWKAFREYANGRGVTLFGDMPIYIALDSADAWASREILSVDDKGRPDYVAGVPPDYFSEDGQLWGNPLYDWEHHARTGYHWWIERLEASIELADIVRIDHFRGFEGYWSIPAHANTARGGEWRPGPGDAIFEAMRAALGKLPIVAEDLGVITPEVEALRDRHHMPGMRVLQFDVCDESFALTDIGSQSVCYTGTHDNDTTLGWFRGSPGDIRSQEAIRAAQQYALAITGGTPETIHLDLIRAAFSTAARLAIAPMQDYLGLGSEARINTPGRAGGNWRWRVQESQLTPEFCDNTAELVRASGRQPPT